MDVSKDKQNKGDTYDDQISNTLSVNRETKEQMQIVKNEHWDLDSVDYQFYQNRCETFNLNNDIDVKQEETNDDLELKKNKNQ